MVNFKENYHFSRFLRGSNIFQGGPTFSGVGVPIAYSYRKYITCDFPGEVRTPPPLDPHLGLSMVLSIHAENAPNLTNRYLGMFLEGQVDRQTDRRVHRRSTPKQYPSDFIRGKPVLSTGYLMTCSRTQRSASGEARTRNPPISGQALYHDCAPQLGSILCRYDIAGYTICTSREHIVYGAFCGSTNLHLRFRQYYYLNRFFTQAISTCSMHRF